VKDSGGRVRRPVVREDDLAGDLAVAKELGASPEAFLDATRLVISGEDEGEDALSARRTAASEPTPVAARSRTAALVALAVPLALGALACLVVVAVLVHCPDRQIDPAHEVDLSHLDLHLVADLDRVLDAVHALG